MGAIRPMPADYKGMKVFNLAKWPQIWPNDAITELMEGGDYADVVSKYNITLVPELMDNELTPASSGEEDEELFH